MQLLRTDPAGVRRQISLLVGGTTLLLVLGLLGNWPWLAAEHARLDPLHAALVWAADGTAVIWMLAFGLWHGLLGAPLPARPGVDRILRWLVLSLAVGMAIDLGATVASALREEEGRDRAVPALQAELTGGRASHNGRLGYVECRLQDRAGTWHDGRLHLPLDGQPPAVAAAVRAGQFPVPVDLKYDPEWPARCWPDPEPAGQESLYVFSICALVFQGVLLPVGVYHLWASRGTLVPLPAFKLVPVWAVVLPLCCGAFGKLIIGEW